MAYDGRHCPKCGEEIETMGEPHGSALIFYFQNVRCPACQAEFVETFTLTSLDEVDDKGKTITTHGVK